MVKVNKSSIYFKGNNKEFMGFIKDYFFLDITLCQYLRVMHNTSLSKKSI